MLRRANLLHILALKSTQHAKPNAYSLLRESTNF